MKGSGSQSQVSEVSECSPFSGGAKAREGGLAGTSLNTDLSSVTLTEGVKKELS